MSELKDALAGFDAVRDLRTLQQALRRFAGVRASTSDVPEGFLQRRIAVVSNQTTDLLVPALQGMLARVRVWADVEEAGYDQWEQALRHAKHRLWNARPDVLLVLLTSSGLVAADPNPAHAAERIGAALRAFRGRSDARVVLALPEPLPEETSSASWAYRWRVGLDDALRKLDVAALTTLDLAPLIRSIGAERWYAPRYWINAKLPFHPDVTHRVAAYLADAVRAQLGRRTKVVVTDADDTLWAGIVGDEGWDRIDLDTGGRGYPHLRLQRFLRELRERGVLLALVSKNEPKPVLDVLRQRQEMILSESDFADIEVSWGPKSVAIQRILHRLNLTTSGVVFIDDARFEREEVRAAMPDVSVPELPSDPAEWLEHLARTGLFEEGPVTEEDLERTRFYEEERQRRTAQETLGDYGAFLSTLDMCLSPEAIDKDPERVVELLAKTNQFNLTGRRYGIEALRLSVADGGIAYAYRFADRYGHYGLISAIVAAPEGNDAYRVDTWVMSCRAMGRTVERAIMRHLVDTLRKRGARSLAGEYVRSDKNAPVADLYAELGFTVTDTDRGSVANLTLDDAAAAALEGAVRIAEPAPL